MKCDIFVLGSIAIATPGAPSAHPTPRPRPLHRPNRRHPKGTPVADFDYYI